MLPNLGDIWKSLEKRNITLLYIAGGLMFISLLEYFAAMFRLSSVFRLQYLNLGSFIWSPLSGILAMLAVWGFFPVHTDQAPPSAKIGTIFLALTLLTHFGLLVGNILNNIGSMIGTYAFVPSFIYSVPYTIIYLIVTVATFLFFSYAVYNTDTYPNMLGNVLLILVFISVGWMVRYIISIYGIQSISREILSWASLSFYTIEMLAYLAMGYILSNPEEVKNFRIGRYVNRTQHRV